MGKASGASTALDTLDHTRCASVTKTGGFLPLGRFRALAYRPESIGDSHPDVWLIH